ncbi:alpha/beta fold hydrolase [Streptomyces sp. 184]|uniref:alpha/beta fold hydrolase n=1 Tax=Streptomyces sp. 184 TaxID=1827526 RepID=UPI003891871C
MPSTEPYLAGDEVPPATGSSASVPPPPSEGRGGVTRRQVTLSGLTLAVHSHPAAAPGLPPAVYVHGLGGSALNWAGLGPLLAGRVDGDAVDLPGFGDSPPPDDGDYSLSGHARAVIRYLDAGERGPVHLFGNSLGGTIVTRVAALRPDLVRTLTLVSPALPELPPQPTAVPTALLALPGVTALFARLTRNWTAEQRTRAVLGLCYGDPERVSPEGFAEHARAYAKRMTLPYHWDAMERSARGVVGAYTLGGQHSLWRLAERVLAPTLLIYGGRDQLVSFRMARRAKTAFRNSRLLALPAAGHVAMMEYPEVVARAFTELLDEYETGAADASPGRS